MTWETDPAIHVEGKRKRVETHVETPARGLLAPQLTRFQKNIKGGGFKKWQNSIWVSPYAMDREIEEELNDLGKKFSVRLIKTTQINHNEDLEKMFEEN